MTDLATFRDQIVTDLRPGFDAKVKIGTHPGAMTLAEAQAYATGPAAIYIALLSGPEYSNTDAIANVKVGAYCICKNGKAGLYDKQVLLLASQVFGFVHATKIGGSDAERPQALAFQNLHTRDLGEQGIGLAAITWTQNVAITVPAPGELAAFLTLYQTITIGGDDLPTDIVNLPQS